MDATAAEPRIREEAGVFDAELFVRPYSQHGLQHLRKAEPISDSVNAVYSDERQL